MVEIVHYNEPSFDGDLLSRIKALTKNPYIDSLFEPCNGVIDVVVARDGRDVGCAVVYNDGGLLIDNVYVSKEHRRKGIGRMMIESIIGRHKSEINVISLKSATPFWMKMGFKVYDGDRDIDMMIKY